MTIHSLFFCGLAIISFTICAYISFNSSKEQKWYYRLAEILFMAFILFYGLISVSLRSSTQEFTNIVLTIILVSSILQNKRQNSEQVFIVSFSSAALLFGLQLYLNNFDHTDNKNKETIISYMVNIKNDFIGGDLEKITSQSSKNDELIDNFTEYIKYKETVCLLKIDSIEKTARLVAFNIDHKKDAIKYKNGIKTIQGLVYGMSERMSFLKKESDKKAFALQQKRMENIYEYEDKLSDFIYNFDNCSYKNKLKSNTLFDESEKAQKTIDEVTKEAESILFKDYK